MIRIEKKYEPKFWKDFRVKKKVHTYRELDNVKGGPEIRLRLREELFSEQKGLCCYCCASIDIDDSHNEHFLPQSRFPNKSMDYKNIFCSCNCKKTCGNSKKNSEVEIVNPSEMNPESHFEYLDNGKIIGSDQIGKDTIDVLNLNHPTLVEKREALFKECIRMCASSGKEEMIKEYANPDPSTGRLPRFYDMLEYFIKKGIFDDSELLKKII